MNGSHLPPIIIDVEASGFGAHSYPIEVGVALASGDKYCTLIYLTASGQIGTYKLNRFMAFPVQYLKRFVRHRASQDAIIIQKTYMETRQGA